MSLASSSVTTGFVDLATYDEQEKYCYGGEDSTAYFVRETQKATWFTQIPVLLTRGTGQADFNQDWSVNVSRAGDYLLQTWLRVTIPSVELSSSNPFGADGRLRWTRNLMHNLVKDCIITFNDMTAAEFTSTHLDFWAAFTTPAGKYNGYNNMIGNIDQLIQPSAPGVAIDSLTLNLPLPFFFSRDTGVALPTAALPYNEIRIQFSFRNYTELLIVDNVNNTAQSVPVQSSYLVGGAPVIAQTQVWANYAIVSNEERRMMGCAPRDILIEQAQFIPSQTFNPLTQPKQSYDIRLAHSIKLLLFGVRNKTNQAERSNYTCASPVVNGTVMNFTPAGAVDPIAQTSLIYESSPRLSQMGSDYYSLIQPWFHAPVIPLQTGYHMYSYALDFIALDPMGSTNYGKLVNVSIIPEASQMAITAATGGGAINSGYKFAQTFEFHLTAVNFNIIRISGGALGFPVL